MGYVYAILTVGAAALILSVPFRIRVRADMSYGRGFSVIAVYFIGIRMVHIKTVLADGRFKVYIDGKRKDDTRARRSERDGKKDDGGAAVLKIIGYLLDTRILFALQAAAYIGGEDAMSAALRCGAFNAAMNMLPQSGVKPRVYCDFDNDRMDATLNMRLRLTVTDALKIAAAIREGRTGA